jgi:very-short-patch-repair endonuclease
MLGIECDGPSYHSSRSARDRDRFRQQVLEERGWRIHPIWSTDWFQRTEEQLRNMLAAIENARISGSQASHAPILNDQPAAAAQELPA